MTSSRDQELLLSYGKEPASGLIPASTDAAVSPSGETLTSPASTAIFSPTSTSSLNPLNLSEDEFQAEIARRANRWGSMPEPVSRSQTLSHVAQAEPYVFQPPHHEEDLAALSPSEPEDPDFDPNDLAKFETEDGVLFAWPLSGRYDDFARNCARDARLAPSLVPLIFKLLTACSNPANGALWPLREPGAGTFPAPYLLRRLETSFRNANDRFMGPKYSHNAPRVGATATRARARPVKARSTNVSRGNGRTPEHAYARRYSPTPVTAKPTPSRPPPGTEPRELAKWVRELARAAPSTAEERPAYNLSADALRHGTWAGSLPALENARATAGIYSAKNDKTRAKNQPSFRFHAVRVCGEYCDTLDKVARHCKCFGGDAAMVEAYKICRRHVVGDATNYEWSSIIGRLEGARVHLPVTAVRWETTNPDGSRSVVYTRAPPCKAQVQVQPSPVAPDVPWHPFGPAFVGQPWPKTPWGVRYQGPVASALVGDWACGCDWDCERSAAPAAPGDRVLTWGTSRDRRFWADPTGESAGTWHYQGGAMSTVAATGTVAPNVVVAHTFPQVDAIMAVMAGPDGSLEKSRKLVRVAAFLAGVASSDSIMSIASHVVSFVAGDQWLYERVASWIASLAARLAAWQGEKHQGPSKEDEETAGFFTSVSRAVFASAALVALKELVGVVDDALALGVAEFAKAFKILAAKNAAEQVMGWLQGAFKEFWQRLMSAWNTGSWAPLWGTGADPARWARHARGTIDNHQLLVTPEPRPGGATAKEMAELVESGAVSPLIATGVTTSQYLAELQRLRDQGQRFLETLPAGQLATSIRVLVNELNRKANVVSASIRGAAKRPVPFFIYLTGPVGTGKTNLGLLLYKAIGNRHGLPIDDRSRWPWQVGANFQDGLDASHWSVSFDDVDHIKGTYAANMELFPQTITRLVNNEAFPVEAAAVEDKGTRFAQPLLVTQCSNFDAGAVHKYGAVPEAFWRRVSLWAEVRVKPAYRKEAAGGQLDEIDPEKVKGAVDIYEIYLGTYRGAQKDESDSFFTKATQPIGVAEFAMLAYDRFKAHMERQHVLLQKYELSGGCPACGLPTREPHGCPSERRQGPRRRAAVLEMDRESFDDTDADDDDTPFRSGPANRAAATEERAVRMGVPLHHVECCFNVPVGCCTAYHLARRCVCDQCQAVGYAGLSRCLLSSSGRTCLARAQAAAETPCGRALTVAAGYGLTAVGSAVFAIETAVGTFPIDTAAMVFAAAGAFLMLRRAAEMLHQGRGAGVDTSTWTPVPSVFGPNQPSTPPGATWTLSEIEQAVARSVFPLHINGATAYALALTPNLLAIPTHLLPKDGSLSLDFGQGPQRVPFKLEWAEKSTYNPELTYVAARSTNTAGVLPYLPEVSNMAVAQFDECKIAGGPDRSVAGAARMVRALDSTLRVVVPASTQDGDCGRPYLLKTGRYWWVGAVHFAGMFEAGICVQAIGAPVNKREVAAVLRRLDPGVTTGGPAVVPQSLAVSPAGAPLEFGPKPRVSEVLTAIATGRGVQKVYLGTLANGPAGSTAQTRMRPTPFAHHFRDLELKYCGQTPYWGPPIFKGAMVGDRWESPMQHAFEASLGVWPDQAAWTVAIMDFLSGAENLYWDELRFLSLHEAIVGFKPLWRNPVNPSTSSGPPTSEKKWNMIDRVGDDVKLRPDLLRQVEEIWATLNSGSPVSVPGQWVMKDEPRKPGGEARLFTVLPAAFNIVLGQICTPITAAMRTHPEFFECWVGIDMTSPDAERLVRYLKHVNPRLDRVGDQDAKKQDKSYTEAAWQAVRLVFSAIAYHAGLDRKIVELAERSAHAVRFMYKKDVFESNEMPSGIFGVIERNSIVTAIDMRFQYYRARPDVVARVDWKGWLQRFPVNPTVPVGLGLSFRGDCANANFGDDNQHALRPGVPPIVNPPLLLAERGIVVTAGDKSENISLGPLGGTSFLKRTFVFDPELGYHIAPLNLKSVVKTAVMRGPSSLSDADHSALVLTQVVRESVLHGEAVFSEFRSRALAAAAEMGIADHKLLKIHDYANYRRRLKEGVFSVYKDLGEVGSADYFPVDGAGLIGTEAFQSKMTSSSEQQSSGATAPIINPTTDVGHAGAALALSATELAVAPSLVGKDFQQLPAITPSDFLERPVKIDTWSTTFSGTGPTTVHDFDPWALLMANAALADKLANVAYIQAELELEIICTASPALYGVIDVSLVAVCGPYTTAYTKLNPYRSREMTVGHFDLSLSNSVKLTVPWLWYYDFAELPAGATTAWRVVFTALHPLESGIAGGSTEARFTTYARILPGYKLGATRYQGKKTTNGRAESWRGHAEKAAAFVEERSKGFPRDGPVSSVAASISAAAGKLEGLPMIGGAAAMAKMGASAVAGIAAFFGYSRDPQPLQIVGVRTSALDNPAATELVDHGLPMALLGTGLLDPDPALADGGPGDELSFASLGGRPTYIAGASFGAGDGVGHQILKLPVTPFYFKDHPDGGINLTAAGYCGMPFSFWRGDLVYHVDVIAPTTARGALQITWQPPASWSADPTNVTYSKVIDFEGYTRFEFLVGYAREIPFLPRVLIRDDTPIVPVGHCNGFITLTVVNPLLVTNPGNNVYVRVWLSGGANLDFRVPAATTTVLYADGSYTSALVGNGFRYQAGPGPIGGSDADFLPQQLELVPSSGTYPTDTLNYPGTGVFSARAMVQKATAYQRSLEVDRMTTPGMQEWEIRGPQMRTTNEHGWATNGCGMGFNYAAYYAALFVGWSGAQHFAYHGWAPAAVAGGVVTAVPGMPPPYYLPPASAANATGPNGGVSFIVPYTSSRRFYPTAGDISAWPDLAATKIWFQISGSSSATTPSPTGPAADETISGVWYHSYGPDFRPSQFRQVPTIWFEFAGNGRNAQGSRAPTYTYFGAV